MCPVWEEYAMPVPKAAPEPMFDMPLSEMKRSVQAVDASVAAATDLANAMERLTGTVFAGETGTKPPAAHSSKAGSQGHYIDGIYVPGY